MQKEVNVGYSDPLQTESAKRFYTIMYCRYKSNFIWL